MKVWQFDWLLAETGWIKNARVLVDASGGFKEIFIRNPKNYKLTGREKVQIISGIAIPGFINAHSHAFQYAMVGKAEHIPELANGDDFWSWRQNMYHLAMKINPSQMYTIATCLYEQMLRMGYTRVIEFHYLHKDFSGKFYAQKLEMSHALLQAAEDAGILMTLVPVYYRQGDFGKGALPTQKRFLFDHVEQYFEFLKDIKTLILKSYSKSKLGFGVHSLRAATMEDCKKIFSNADFASLPKHLHLSEQAKEVESCLAFTKQRPGEYFFNSIEVDETFHFVHGTHLNDAETETLAHSGASVVLCPSTEGNLGDGFFNLEKYAQFSGKWCIGTDSQIGLDPREELRWLDYTQRLLQRVRNIHCQKKAGDSAFISVNQARINGLTASGYKNPQNNFFLEDSPFDVVVLDSNHPSLSACNTGDLLAGIIYAADATVVKGVVVGNQFKASSRNGVGHQKVLAKYSKTVQSIHKS